jgi:hypothetical protein
MHVRVRARPIRERGGWQLSTPTPVCHVRNDTPIRPRALLYIEFLVKHGQMIARVHDPVSGRGASQRAPYHQVPS